PGSRALDGVPRARAPRAAAYRQRRKWTPRSGLYVRRSNRRSCANCAGRPRPQRFGIKLACAQLLANRIPLQRGAAVARFIQYDSASGRSGVAELSLTKEQTLPKRELQDIQELTSLVGQEVAVGDWLEITQERINQFADATSDHQWIHVDPERCKRESPFGTTIAHGYLTLSLIPYLSQQSFAIRQPFRMGINYGSNRVRFTSPVPAGSRIRNRMTVIEVSDVSGGWQVRWQVTIEIEGKDKPA